MADRNLKIIATVVDKTTANLRNIDNSLKGFGNSVNKASTDVTKFNRTLFSLTAFIYTFERAFRGLGTAVAEGAQFQRVSDQFEGLFGARGQFSNLIDNFTDNFVDQFEAMKEGSDLKRLGIVSDVNQLASLMAMASTAAKKANKTSAEGIQEISAFLKDGSISHLEFLDVVARTNPALKAQLTILKATGGVLGGVISQQQALKIGMNLLKSSTNGSMKGFKDMLDQVLSVEQAFTFFKKSIGSFLASALVPLINTLKPLIINFTVLLDNARKNDKNLVFLARSVIFVTSAFAGLVAVLGTFRLIAMSLTSLGVGVPALTFALLGLTGSFLGLTAGTEKFTDKLKLFAAFFRGAFQLVHSFLTDPENFAKGIGKMDKSIYDLLQKNGLLQLAITIARLSSVGILFIRDVGNKLISWGVSLEKTISNLMNTFLKLFGLMGGGKGGFSRGLIDSSSGIRKTLVDIAAASVAIFGAFKAFSVFRGALGGIPLIGKFLGGGGGRPTGTKTNPIYTRSADGGMLGFGSEVFGGALGGGAFGAGIKGLINKTVLSGLLPKAGVAYLGAGAIGLGTNVLGELMNSPEFERNFMKETDKYGMSDWLMHPGNLLTATGLGLSGLFGSTLADTTTKTNTVIPTIPENQADALDILGEKLKEMHGVKQQQFQGMIEQAMSPGSMGGTKITKEEWAQLMTYAMRRAIDTSATLNKPLSGGRLGDNSNDYRR